MKLALITDSIRTQSTGIGFYTKDIIDALLKEKGKKEYIFIDYTETSFNKNQLLQIKNPFKFFKTYLWHSYLPFKLKKDFDYIFNFSACPHPFPYKQKEIFFVYDISWYLFPKYHPASRVLFYKLFFKICLQNSYKIVVDSISTKEDLIKFFDTPPEKISIIYPTLPKNTMMQKKNNMNIDFPYFLFIGTLEPRKNIESIIKAFKLIKDQKNIRHKLILCGKKGWMYKDIFQLISSLKLENDIIYKGYITDQEKSYLFHHAECFVFPSYYEGFGIPVLEALQSGCPVITSNVSSLPEVAGKAGILVDPNNTDELAHAMNTIITNEKVRKKMREEGYKQIKNISNEKQIQSLLESL